MNKEQIKAKVLLCLPLTERERAIYILFIAKDKTEYEQLL